MNPHQPGSELLDSKSSLPIAPINDAEAGVCINGDDTTREALQSVIKELQEEVRRTLDAASSSIVEETRTRLRNELAAALEAFGKEASSRLRLLEEEHLANSLDRVQAELAGRVQQQISEIHNALNKPCAELKSLAVQADTAANGMATAVDSAAKQLQTAEQKAQVRFSEVVNDLQKGTENLLQSSAGRLQKEADEVAQRLSAELRASQTSLIEEANRQAATLKRTLVDDLTREAEKIAQSYRDQIRQKLPASTEPKMPRPASGEDEFRTKDAGITGEIGARQPAEQPKRPPQKEFGMTWDSPAVAAGVSWEQRERPYTEVLRNMAAARQAANRPVLRPPMESRWRPAATSISLAFLLLAIFVVTSFYALRRARRDDLSTQTSSHAAASLSTATQTGSPSAAPPQSAVPRDNRSAGNKLTSLPGKAGAPATPNVSSGSAPERSASETGEDAGAAEGRRDLTVTSDAPGAQIALDGHTDPAWVTPHTFHDLAARFYLVAVYKQGYEPTVQNVKVGPGSDAMFHAHLAAASGEITIITDPAGLQVSIDGKPFGPSPAHAVLPLGQHTYQVSPPPGKAKLTKTFTIRAAGDILRHTVSW